MSTFDISDTLAPTSEQLDAIDLHQSGPRVFTVDHVTEGPADQPVQVHFVEFPRPWRPGKSMRRVLADCWGAEAAQWTGHRVKLWCDPKVSFGGQQVGGVRVLAVSHIDKPKSVPLILTRGKSAMYKVDPLPDEIPLITRDQLSQLGRLLKEVDLTDRDETLALIGGWIGRRIGATKELAAPEAAVVINRLAAMKSDAEPEDGQ